MTKEEFIQSVKIKNPKWSNIPDDDLYTQVIKRYPMYQKQIDGLPRYKDSVEPTVIQKPQSILQEAGQDIKQTYSGLKDVFNRTKQDIGQIAEAEVAGEQGKFRSFAQTIGRLAGGVSSGIGELFKGATKVALTQEGEDKLKSGLGTAIEKIVPIAQKLDEMSGSPVGTFMKNYESLDDKTKRDVDSLLGVTQLAFDLATAGTTKKVGQIGVEKGVELGSKAVDTGIGAVEKGTDLAKRATSKIIKSTATPPPTPLKAVGQVLQGKTEDIAKGVKGLSKLDTTGVKTFKELEGTIQNKISDLAKQVDSDLALDATKKPLQNLIISSKSAGNIVQINPVEKALKQLDELYTKIGDTVESANIKELLQTARTEGLTNLEINDIARVYGQQFGQKAFSKMGDPLTSVNAQLFENTRKAVKKIARQGISGKEAKMADEAMSNLYNTQRLIKKNVEAVNKITQKINERGLFEKIGHAVAKYGNVLTGGTIRGVVGGLLPRGAGYKVMNALDIEKALQKNLEIIQSAIKSNSDKEIVNLLKTIDKPFKPPAVGKTVSKDPLIQEAKKYKSAEPMKYFLESKGVKVNSDNTVTLYHGTSKEAAKMINESGLIKPAASDTKSYLTPFKKRAVDWATGKGEPTIVEVRVPVEEARYLPSKGINEFIAEGGLKRDGNVWRPKKLPKDDVLGRLAEKKYSLFKSK
jgi:hypothetical protein